VYYSDETYTISVQSIKGKCQVREKVDVSEASAPGIFDNIFFCEHLYDPATGSLKKVVYSWPCFYNCMTAFKSSEESAKAFAYFN
jgi:hypothetical protein